jgi:hypothetical protein
MSDTIEGYAANSAKRGKPEHYSIMVRHRADPLIYRLKIEASVLNTG